MYRNDLIISQLQFSSPRNYSSIISEREKRENGSHKKFILEWEFSAKLTWSVVDDDFDVNLIKTRKLNIYSEREEERKPL
jgi:hypothetical protein